MSRKTQPEKSKLVNRLSGFMGDGDIIILGKWDGKPYAQFVQIDKVAPDVSVMLARRAAVDLVNWVMKALNLIDSHDDNV